MTELSKLADEVEELKFQRDETCRLLNEQIDKTKEARALAAHCKSTAKSISDIKLALDRIESENPPTGEPSESVYLGRQQVVDEIRAILRGNT